MSDQSDQAAPILQRQPRHAEDFDAFYLGVPPWDIGRPQPCFARLAEAGQIIGRVLDVGCGTGEHALLCATLGLEVTGIDAAPRAIELAKLKAGERGLEVRFVLGDAFELAVLGEQYDTVLDSGLFHSFFDEDRSRLVRSLKDAVAPAGRYYLLCFSDLQPGDWGPRRVTQSEIRTSFADGWRVDSIEAETFEVTAGEDGASAWLATITRLGG